MTAHRYNQVFWFLIHDEDSATVLLSLVTCFSESKAGTGIPTYLTVTQLWQNRPEKG